MKKVHFYYYKGPGGRFLKIDRKYDNILWKQITKEEYRRNVPPLPRISKKPFQLAEDKEFERNGAIGVNYLNSLWRRGIKLKK